jgi:hypothetical protein
MDKLKVGDIIRFGANSQFGKNVGFARPPATRKHIVVGAKLDGGSAAEGYPDVWYVTVLPLDAHEELHPRFKKPLTFVQGDEGWSLYSNDIKGFEYEGFRSVTITTTEAHTAKGVKKTVAYQLG